jgi:hypothetical protein
MPSKIDRIALDTARSVLEPLGFSCTQEGSHRHPCIRVTRDGHSEKLVYACSPRTENTENWMRQKAKKMLREWPKNLARQALTSVSSAA